MRPQPLIAVHDVEYSSKWYQHVLGSKSNHGGAEYEQLLNEQDEMILQLHQWEAHHHPYLGDPNISKGNGVLLWFETSDFDALVERLNHHHVEILETVKVNTNANHREVWFKDPGGYVIVVASQYGDI
ncbi:VOC family protein [Acinetobacter sp. WU_MDCI_Axc73]|nr:VOC family protein [Acinetobacter sp. WU_MDCI_Axc73]